MHVGVYVEKRLEYFFWLMRNTVKWTYVAFIIDSEQWSL